MRKFTLMFIGIVLTICGGLYVYQKMADEPEAVLQGQAVSDAPDFRSINDVREKKHAFFSYLKPGVAFENARILQERSQITQLQHVVSKGKMSAQHRALAIQLGQRYGIEWQDTQTEAWFDAMWHRVDVLPEALVLTQAANESAWGTSRFAREANNYFGQWCYVQGCGLVPLARQEGMTHEVAKFSSVQESIHRYFMNVNRNPAYHDLREIRFQLRQRDADLFSVESAMALSNGLLKYSERGEDYVHDLQTMMRHNQPYWQSE
ncbi:glucosaminidase [Vibrio sp. V27_P1S3P104]|nr:MULTISPECIES: glucosaminidase domain-containing protein [unclassified Vibrio]NAW67954.1 glucosaminidase [Vibrio sp. V28_P6S34P95]NAX04714.1 glucosaminidase [Vibrio sp. V30_P3S12P165]NAX33498.1 glucosaminidase [Vibrio sp. V29_P1S30P107]NAX36998.1 glucosaminidase [Vibrio sp. V27_P1S3P104]NAX40018.1 glucosaminidase [Vibrio sp. V26_P1S5P106]